MRLGVKTKKALRVGVKTAVGVGAIALGLKSGADKVSDKVGDIIDDAGAVQVVGEEVASNLIAAGRGKVNPLAGKREREDNLMKARANKAVAVAVGPRAAADGIAERKKPKELKPPVSKVGLATRANASPIGSQESSEKIALDRAKGVKTNCKKRFPKKKQLAKYKNCLNQN